MGNVRLIVVVVCLALFAGCAALSDRTTSASVPFVTTPHKVVREMLKLADVTQEDLVYDLGSGDGRIVIAAARTFGARAVGVEIDPKLLKESEENAEKAGVGHRVRFLQQDIFQTDLRDATVITMFLLPGVNAMLAPKFMNELSPGTRIVSHMFDMGEWQPDRTTYVGISTLHYWVVPADIDGTWRFELPFTAGPKPVELFIRQAYQKLTGWLRIDGRKLTLVDPRIEGARLSFSTEGAIDGQATRMLFSATASNRRLAGRVEVTGGPRAGSYDFDASPTR